MPAMLKPRLLALLLSTVMLASGCALLPAPQQPQQPQQPGQPGQPEQQGQQGQQGQQAERQQSRQAPLPQETRNLLLRLDARAMHAYHRDQPEEALELYRRILGLDDSREIAWYRLGNLLTGKGELEAAMEAYQRALALKPDYTDARYNLGLVHIRHGAATFDQAREILAREDPAAAFSADRYLAYLLADLIQGVDIAVECDCEQTGEPSTEAPKP